jgi:hypothetical protein
MISLLFGLKLEFRKTFSSAKCDSIRNFQKPALQANLRPWYIAQISAHRTIQDQNSYVKSWSLTPSALQIRLPAAAGTGFFLNFLHFQPAPF